jgi:FRG domain
MPYPSLPVIEVDSWEAFLGELSKRLEDTDPGTYCFRGQSRFRWTLKPSMLRLLDASAPTSAAEAHELERTVLAQFTFNSGTEIARLCQPDMLSQLALMQHFRAPTRLLDWTFSPYVAAYFAVEENWDEDGAIWFFDSIKSNMRQGFCRLRDSNVPESAPPGGIRFNVQPNWYELERTRDLTYSCIRVNAYGFERMVAPQGLFTVSSYILDDHEEVLRSAAHTLSRGDRPAVGKMRIPSSLKRKFLMHLRYMNIAANSLFPGMDGIGRSMAELVRLRISIASPEPTFPISSAAVPTRPQQAEVSAESDFRRIQSEQGRE